MLFVCFTLLVSLQDCHGSSYNVWTVIKHEFSLNRLVWLRDNHILEVLFWLSPSHEPVAGPSVLIPHTNTAQNISMAEISYDIASCILQEVVNTYSPRQAQETLFSICQSNKAFYRLARKLLYRRVYFSKLPRRFLDTLQTSPSLCPMVQELDFSSMNLCPIHCGHIWDSLADLLPGCANLRRISFGTLSSKHLAKLLRTMATHNTNLKDG